MLRPLLSAAAICLFSLVFSGLDARGVSPPAQPDARPDSDDWASAAAKQIDQLLEQSWRDHGVRPASEASDGIWCRRVYLDLIGRIPTVAELNAYLTDKARHRDARLVDRLLSSAYAPEYARHWATVWTNLLIGRTGGTEARSPISRPGMTEYLAASFLENKPYDVLSRELIGAVGAARPEMEDYNGAVNFLVGKMEEDGVQATAKTAQIFLGMAVQCTQCHNHPFNEYQQNQFWELNAFFRQTRVEENRMDRDDRTARARLVNGDFAGEGRRGRGDDRSDIFLELRNGELVDRDRASVHAAPLFYELRNGQLRTAYPVFIDGRSLAEKYASRGVDYGNSGRLDEVNRREELVDLVLSAEEFPRAQANRAWSHFFGHGFTKPVDDMGPHNPPSHPELLDELAQRFAESGYNLKELYRAIVLSKAYRLSSRIASGNVDDNPELGRPPLFSRFYLRQMQAEQLYESLLTATQAEATADGSDRDALKSRWLRQITTAFGNDEQTEACAFNGTIPQALMMMNGDLVRRACRIDSGSFLDTVARDPQLTNREKITHLYRAALSRPPGRDERAICNDLLAAREGDVVAALQDIWWAVLNSNEFILIH